MLQLDKKRGWEKGKIRVTRVVAKASGPNGSRDGIDGMRRSDTDTSV